MTYQHPWYTLQLQLENTTNSESESTQNPKPETIGPKSTNSSRMGDYWEYHVMCKALERGAEVFKNISCVGKIDMRIDWNGQSLPCDVKAKVERNKSYPGKYYQDTLNVIPEDVYMVCVDPTDGSVSWHTQRVPEGWEDFWN